MSIDKLTKLFSARLNSERANPETIQGKVRNNDLPADAGAVRVARDFGTGAGGDAGERKARVAELKQQVDQGSYESDSNSVAKAVYRDLFA